MTHAELSAAALVISLEQVASASSEQTCAAALVGAASLIQQAVLDDQDPQAFHSAIDAVPGALGVQLRAVMDRAVNFHMLEDGGTLGLWMVPVVLSTPKVLPSIIALETKSLNAMKMSGCLLQQLKLSPAKSGGVRTGWTYVVPALYSEAQIRNTDLGELIRLPHESRQVIRGELKTISFDTGEEMNKEGEGSSLYFMPFVSYSPEGLQPSMPDASQKAIVRMTKWIAETLAPVLGDDFSSHIAHQPQPFTLALRVGERLRMDVKLREMMLRVSMDSGVEPNGLTALVAPYATRQSDGTFMVGVSLMSRMTKNIIATLALPVESEDGQEEVALATHILRDMGMASIQQHAAPINTFNCQHCGGVQFALPNPDFAGRGIAEQTAKHMH